ncbi:conserved hypothetical protein [uncultured Defluviicoccus sp.]|uniref:Methyltransferase FkbM domain-containing protein n=1 Tax=metagenome TaxID=256318 RepID=A0A380TD94_9ZZZZ|nr:conserved hypothetical protein [uncultured Defluviicoccus sp.]
MSPDDLEALGFGQVGSVDTPRGTMRYLKQGLGSWRWETILTKEPETIEWIESFVVGEEMWDIGANVGIYGLYAALGGIRVLAFEPHFANYFQLCANIVLNNLQDRVTPYCLAFSDRRRLSTINLAELRFGSALSTFDGDLDCRGEPYQIAFRQGMLGYSLDQFIADFGARTPDHIKIDVDGLELQIVLGGRDLLSDVRLKSVSIELIDTDAAQVDGVNDAMAQSGLAFVHKKQDPQWNNDILNFLYRRP